MPLLVDDDPFLTESPNGNGIYYDLEKFKKCHEMIVAAGELHTIAIIAGEIENHPKMKEYILERKNEFRLAVHGWLHERYWEWPYPDVVAESLERAMGKIITTFGFGSLTKEYYPTWNKRSDAMYAACKAIGLELNDDWMTIGEALSGVNKKAIRFHSWNDNEVEQLRKYLCQE